MKENYQQNLIDSLPKEVFRNPDEINSGENDDYIDIKRIFKILCAVCSPVILIVALFFITGLYRNNVVTAAEIPCFAEFASLEFCEKHAEDGQIFYETLLPKSINGDHKYEVVDQYIDLLTSSYSFRMIGDKVFYDEIFTRWYWFEYTGNEVVTDRTAKLFDGTDMTEYNLSILVHEQENDVIVRVFTAPEIKEVESK